MGNGNPAATRQEAVLIRRPSAPPKQRLVTWKDMAVLLWLGAGVVAAPFPRAVRSQLCLLAARLARLSSRARSARARMTGIAGIAEPQAARAVHLLYTSRLGGYLDVVRGLLFAPDITIRCRGTERLDAARKHGNGAVLWISDFVTAGDVSKVALARAGYRVAHLSRPEHGFTTSAFGIAVFNPLRIRFERMHLAERVVFDRGDPRRAMTRLLAILRENGIVSTDGDAFELSLGSPLAVAGGPREVDLLTAASAYVRELEAIVLARPECWVGWRRSDQLVAP